MKRTVLVFLILILLVVSTVSVYAFASINRSLSRPNDVFQASQKIKDTMKDSLKTTIVAEINGIPICASKIEYKRLTNSYNREYFKNHSIEYDPNAYPLDDDGILLQLAKEQFIVRMADEVGISYSDESILNEIYLEEEYIIKEIENGNEAMIQRQKQDELFLQSLGMTRDEFYQSIYVDILKYNHTVTDYCRYYYFESDLYDKTTTFECYIDNAFNETPLDIKVIDAVQ